MRQKIYRLLVQNPSFTKVIFLLYYRHIIKSAIAALMLLGSSTEVDRVYDAQRAGGSIADLGQDFAFIPVHDAPSYAKPLRIMPLGDSMTFGVIGFNDRASGGYRTELWNKLVAGGFNMSFVGSQSSGPDSLGDKNHEGHRAWTIKQIASSVNGWLEAAQPDLILLMIGTADTRINSIKAMINELSALIDQIIAQAPNVQLLVASIVPVHPTVTRPIRLLRAMYFNTAIPSVVSSKIAQGKKVHFVDMRSLTVHDLTSSISPDLDNGLHPHAKGYLKIANFWYDAILKVTSNRQSALASTSRSGMLKKANTPAGMQNKGTQDIWVRFWKTWQSAGIQGIFSVAWTFFWMRFGGYEILRFRRL